MILYLQISVYRMIFTTRVFPISDAVNMLLEGNYDYTKMNDSEEISLDAKKSEYISNRILTMLINEAYEALYLKIASAEDLDTAMTKGVNYPKGLIEWGQEIGVYDCAEEMDALYHIYKEDRYRCSLGLREG